MRYSPWTHARWPGVWSRFKYIPLHAQVRKSIEYNHAEKGTVTGGAVETCKATLDGKGDEDRAACARAAAQILHSGRKEQPSSTSNCGLLVTFSPHIQILPLLTTDTQ